MITGEQRRAIKAHIGGLLDTGMDYVLHAEADEMEEDSGLIRIKYRVWLVMANGFDGDDIGAIWSETGLLWIDPVSMEYWEKYGARNSHTHWEDLGSGPDDIRSPDIPRAAQLAWIDWMRLRGHWDYLIDYFEGEGEGFLKGFPRGSRKAFRGAKADRCRSANGPSPFPHRGGTATGMGILTMEEYREAVSGDPLSE
jgi:hypothetical protein